MIIEMVPLIVMQIIKLVTTWEMPGLAQICCPLLDKSFPFSFNTHSTPSDIEKNLPLARVLLLKAPQGIHIIFDGWKVFRKQVSYKLQQVNPVLPTFFPVTKL